MDWTNGARPRKSPAPVGPSECCHYDYAGSIIASVGEEGHLARHECGTGGHMLHMTDLWAAARNNLETNSYGNNSNHKKIIMILRGLYKT